MDKIRFLLRLTLLITLALLIVACSHSSSQQVAKTQAVAPPETTIAALLILQPASTPTIVTTPTTAVTESSTTNTTGPDWLMWSTIISAILALITLSGVLVALIIGIKNTKSAAHQEQVALDQLRHAFEATQTSQKDLTLTAYAYAVQGILDLKRGFAEHPGTFEYQMELNRQMKQYIPEYMQDDIPTFLLFAAGMWRFSYVWSVKQRAHECGISPEEIEGLEKEMRLWLEEVPGFYHVYEKHTSQIGAHNPDFLDFLEKKVYNQAWRDSHPDFLIIPKRKRPGALWLRIRGNNRTRI